GGAPVSADDSDEMSSSHDDGAETVFELEGEPRGLASFLVVGRSLGRTVHASWDGRLLTMSARLHEMLRLSLAVEEVYEGSGQAGPRPSARGGVEALLVELMRCLDETVSLEYADISLRGFSRRSWSAS
ncbi:MAG TPA: hypothetical protein VMD59_15470, partial [Acidimicrobiales bacterium]|nr:hypothetical protein [Acidimicrobiales bacterium]